MIKRVFAFKYADGHPVDEMEDWYLDRHTQLAKKMPGIIRYVTYKAIPHQDKNLFAQPKFFRWTEIWWESLESFKQAQSSPERDATLKDNLFPDGSEKFSYFRSAMVGEGLDILNPSREIVDDSPNRGKPAVKAIFAFKYPEDRPLGESEKWYLGKHTQIAKGMPGLMHYVTYKAIASPADPEPDFLRLTELWWEDAESAAAGLNSPTGMEAGKDGVRPDGVWKLNPVTAFQKGPVLVGFPVDIV